MENNMKCLAIGLQDTGKTSYITAFWAIEKDGNTKHKLTFDKYPSDTSYLDSMATLWLNQAAVQRSQINITDLTFDLSLGVSFKLVFPTSRGKGLNLFSKMRQLKK